MTTHDDDPICTPFIEDVKSDKNPNLHFYIQYLYKLIKLFI